MKRSLLALGLIFNLQLTTMNYAYATTTDVGTVGAADPNAPMCLSEQQFIQQYGNVSKETCGIQTNNQSDGEKILFDQTAKQDQQNFINLLIAMLNGAVAGVKMYGFYPCMAPSAYIYYGSNLAYGFVELSDYLDKKKQSDTLLEANLDDSDKTLEALKKAYQQQSEAANKALDRVDKLDTLETGRKAGVVAAGIESAAVLASFGTYTGYCNVALGEGLASAVRWASWGAIILTIANSFNAGSGSQTAGVADDVVGKAFLESSVASKAAEAAVQEAAEEATQAVIKEAMEEAAEAAIKEIAEEAVTNEIKTKGEAIAESIPYGRLAVYGASEILAQILKDDTREAAVCMARRANEYGCLHQRISQRLATLDSGNTSVGVEGSTGVSAVNQVNIDPIDVNTQQQAYQNNCTPQTCPTISGTEDGINQAAGIAGLGGIDPLLTAGKATENMVNGIASGNAQQVNTAAGQLQDAALKRNLEKMKKALYKDINNKLKKQGKRPIDFPSLSEKIAKNMQKSTKKWLDSRGINNAKDFVAYANQKYGKDGAIGKTEKKGTEIKTVSAAPVNLDLNKNNGDEDKTAQPTFDLLLGDDEAKELVDNTPSQSEALQNYEVNEGGINKNPDVPIWKIISSRYVRKYDVFFDRK